MIVEGYTVGAWQSNTYLLAARASGSAVIVDPGQDSEDILLPRIEALGLQPEAVLLTHGHIDHVWSAGSMANRVGIPAYLHPLDRYMLDDPGAALGAPGASPWSIETPADLRDLEEGQRLTLGGITIEVRHTPGHTPGHCVFMTDAILISGDLIFAGSIGRTDFPRGSLEDLMESIRRVVLPMDDEVTILSGHGPETTVGAERTTNPFVLADARGDLPRLLGL